MSQNNGSYASGGLDDLLAASMQANDYFHALPGYIQDMVMQRRKNIQSEDELHRYAENLLQGDK